MVNEAIEPARRNKQIGSSLEAEIGLTLTPAMKAATVGVDLAELFISSTVLEPQSGDAIDVGIAITSYHKCGRCWRHLPDVAVDGALDARCAEVVNG